MHPISHRVWLFLYSKWVSTHRNTSSLRIQKSIPKSVNSISKSPNHSELRVCIVRKSTVSST
jgi:hypothetical protein